MGLEEELSGNSTPTISSMLQQIKELQNAIHKETYDGLCETLADQSTTVRRDCNHCAGDGTFHVTSQGTYHTWRDGYNYYGLGIGYLKCKECNGAGVVNYEVKTIKEKD